MRAKIAILSTLVLIFIAGCSFAEYGVFVSTLNENITLEISSLSSNKTFENPEHYTLVKGGTKLAVCFLSEITAMDSSGHVLFRQVVLGIEPEANKFQKQDERKTYYLVTHDGIYPIPVAWRDSWKEHQEEIIANFDLKAARQMLIKNGLLKE